ncbi:MAG TPA: winged helix-turn-helix domain-containing protein [Fervidobacterium sp.]|nr:nucleoside-diphosphate sugar epimerase [Fervidobacterium sp.]HOK87991.1 winged helix-turn-helix domain-containing protein [Fervidobacterium sp.]HOM74355.1 winged helix-turn-helix domain-containing protein [Fervidobacterium sp.]HOQ40073.1 winged helix-turn-helix domain-containing protein [Fervidobacterium sp.]HPT54549.1 winged helix-turn-helix domain-containing protein [Fervidobacterium sp.]
MESFEFFEYSPTYRQMMILQALSENISIQSEIALRAGIVPSLVNKYLKTFLEKGLVEKDKSRYKLTNDGLVELNYLRLAYLSEISELYKSIELKFQDLFLKLTGKRDIAIYGAGVVGRMIERLITSRSSFNVVSFIDDNKEKIGTRIEGIPVLPLNSVLHVDAVIIASFKNAEVMSKKALDSGLRNVYSVQFVDSKLRLIWRG